MYKTNCKIKAIGSYFPDKVLTNVDISNKISISDMWIQDKLGIKQRHITDEECASDLGYKASLKTLKNAKMVVDDIDLIITYPFQISKLFDKNSTKKLYNELFYQLDYILNKKGKICMILSSKTLDFINTEINLLDFKITRRMPFKSGEIELNFTEFSR